MSTTPESNVRRIAAHHYEFRSRWVFDCDVDEVYEVLSRLEHYAEWWPQVIRSEADTVAGSAVIHLRSALPFTLKLALTRDLEDRASGNLRARVTGDIVGHVGWTITSTFAGTDVRFEQAVNLAHPVVRRIDIGIRPVLQWNHAVAMRGCAEGLRRRLPTGATG